MKGKIFLVIALYIILGIVAFFDFGFQNYLSELIGRRTPIPETAWRKLTENINAQTISPKESDDSLPGKDQGD